MRRILVTLGLASLFVLGASLLGLGVNALRRDRLPLRAPFPYEQDCADKGVKGAGAGATTISVAEARALLGRPGVLFLDARPAEEASVRPLPGARSLPYSFVTPPDAKQLAGLRAYRELVVYCDSPEDRLAKLLADQLRAEGLAGVRVLVGGHAAWHGAGAPR